MATLIKVDGSESEQKPANGKSFTLEELQRFVGGYIQELRMPSGSFLLFDEEGKMKNKPINGRATLIGRTCGTAHDDCVVGDALICTASELD